MIYIGEKHGKFSHLATESKLFDQYYYLSAGKYRRYHGESLLTKLTDLKTMWLNLRDIFRLVIGMIESYFLFKKIKPSSVLLKGGYVCVPAGFGASKSGAFIVTHDSDTVPGLANRLSSRYADVHATGMPTTFYDYPENKMIYTGVPINNLYRKYSSDEIRFLKEKYSIEPSRRVILLIGGSLGAERLNNYIAMLTQELINKANVHIICITGQNKAQKFREIAVESKYLTVVEFTSELFEYTAMADLVIARAGATAMAELAYQQKTVLLIPSPDLAGGHQIKNAEYYKQIEACEVVQESQIKDKGIGYLQNKIIDLLDNQTKANQLAKNLATTTPKDAAENLAKVLLGGKNK